MWLRQDSHSADTPEEGSEKVADTLSVVDADTLSVDNSGDDVVQDESHAIQTEVR